MGNIDTKTIYKYLDSTLLGGGKGGFPDYKLLAGFSDWLTAGIHQFEGFENVDEADLVDVAIDHPESFDVYFTRHGYEGDPSFVICKKGLDIPQIWKELEIQKDVSLKEFYYWLFRIDEDGNASDTAVAKERGFPKHHVFNDYIYSYNRKENRKPFQFYTTIRGKEIPYGELDDLLNNFQSSKVDPKIEFEELHQQLVKQFGITDEEAEDILINFYGWDWKYLTEGGRKPKNKYRVFFIHKSTDTSDSIDVNAYSALQARTYVRKLPDVYHVADVALLYDASEEPKEEDTISAEKCPKCGGRLNDSGECPLCDLNDESVLEEEVMKYQDSEELFSMTPYMLRNDGALLECGELHPYIKMSNSASYETNLKTLNSHPDFLDWFYNNTKNEETKELINEFKKEPNEELMNLLNDLTNQEFCRVRTSNYKIKYGGDNGQIYFRISSVGFNWFDLIWNTVSKFSKSITEVTVMKDKQTFGGKEFDYYYDHLPTDEFLTLKGNPIVEGK